MLSIHKIHWMATQFLHVQLAFVGPQHLDRLTQDLFLDGFDTAEAAGEAMHDAMVEAVAWFRA